MPSMLPMAIESYVVGLRERFVKEEIEPLRKKLGVPMDGMGPMIGLSTSHYSSMTSARRYAPMEILMLYRDVLRDRLSEGEKDNEH